MLEWALLFYAFAVGAPALGYPEAATTALRLTQIFFLAWLAAGLLAAIFHRPIERRILHHAPAHSG